MRDTRTHFLKNQHGGVAIMMGLALLTLVIAIGTSIEMGRIFLLRTKASNALDSAALAAASIAVPGITEQKLKQRATPFFKANFPDKFLGSTIHDFKMSYENNTVVASMTPKLPLYFGNFLGFKTVDVPVAAQVSRRAQNVEIALALDHTSSLCNIGSCGKGSLWDGLKGAVTVLKEELERNAPSKVSTVYYSYIPFRHTVRMNGTALYDAATNPTDYTAAVQNLPDVKGLTTDIGSIITTMGGVNMNANDQGGTNTAVGTYWAWRSLRPQDVNLFRGSSKHEEPTQHPAPFQYQTALYNPNNPTYKYLLLLTDGINAYYYNGRPFTDQIANFQQAKLCDDIKQEHITIYTIGYGNTVRQNGPTRTLLESCATSTAHFYLPRTPEELRVVFQQIARAISSLQLTQ